MVEWMALLARTTARFIGGTVVGFIQGVVGGIIGFFLALALALLDIFVFGIRWVNGEAGWPPGMVIVRWWFRMLMNADSWAS